MRPWDHCPSSTAFAGMAPTWAEEVITHVKKVIKLPLCLLHKISVHERCSYLALGHQLSLCGRCCLHQCAGGCSDGFGCLQNLLFKVQALISLLFENTSQSYRYFCRTAGIPLDFGMLDEEWHNCIWVYIWWRGKWSWFTACDIWEIKLRNPDFIFHTIQVYLSS